MSATQPRGAPASRPLRAVATWTPDSVPPDPLTRRKGFLSRLLRDDPRTRRRLSIVFAIVILAFSVAPVVNHYQALPNKDYNLWYATGWFYYHGEPIYPTDNRPFPFMYPPTAAALLAIVSVLGEPLFVVALLAANAAAWVGAVLLSVKLATGAACRQKPLLYLLPTLMVVPFVHDMFLLGQPNLLLLTLLLGAFTALRAGREWPAGALIALAVGIKAFPLLALPYLVYRRRWKAVAATGIVGAALLWGLPAVFRGPAGAWSDLKVWTQGMVLKYDEGQIAQRPERCYSFKNQSLVAVANRLLRDVPADGESKDGWHVNVAHLGFQSVNALVVCSALGLGLFYLASMSWRRPRDVAAESAETAMLILLILIFSPFAFNYFYVWLIYPLTVLLARLLDGDPRQRRVLTVGLLVALDLYALSVVSLRGSQAYGNLLAVNLLLLGLLGWTLRRTRTENRGQELFPGARPPLIAS